MVFCVCVGNMFSVFKLLLVTAAEEANVAELQVIMWPYTICLISIVYGNKPILIAQIGWYNNIITFNDTFRNSEIWSPKCHHVA